MATKENYLERAANLRIVAAQVSDPIAKVVIGALVTALEDAAAEVCNSEEAPTPMEQK